MRMVPCLTVSEAICNLRVYNVHLLLAIGTLVFFKCCKQNGHVFCEMLFVCRLLLFFPASCLQKQHDTLCKRHVVTRVQHLESAC